MKLSGGETNRAGTAAYAKGQAMVRTIIETAWRIAIDEGMNGLSMRRIAREMGISPGNLSYYYATKKNTRTQTEKLSYRKYDPVARKHVEFKEAKIK